MDNVIQVKEENFYHEAIFVTFGVHYFSRTISDSVLVCASYFYKE